MYLSICQNDLFQIDEKCTLSLNNQQLGGHQAILTIVNALKHGRSIREIILACSFSELSQSHIKEWSKALVSLANEICSMKHVSIVTTGSQYEDLEQMSVTESLKLFLTVAETTHTTVQEVFTILHPDVFLEEISINFARVLPTCCDVERSFMVS